MAYLEFSRTIPYLKYAFFSYLLLGLTDTIHHLHAAVALGQRAAMHAAMIGIILVPTAIAAVVLYTRYGKRVLLWIFLSIAILAIAVPGLYHGGWNHLIKVLAYLRIDSPSTNIGQIFPAQNYNLWFYEVTGLLEFMFAVVCSYFVYKLVTHRQYHA